MEFAAQLRANPLDHFVWGPIPSAQQSAVPFSASLMAADNNNNLLSNYSGNVAVSAKILSVPGLLISEVDNGTTNQVEFTNPSTNSVNASGWTVVFYGRTTWPQPSRQFNIPAGTVCPPQSVFVIAAGGIAPGVFPRFFIGAPLAWSLSANPVAVALLDNTNRLVDFFCATTAYPYLITNPVPIIPTGWLGAPVQQNPNSSYTYQRQGNFNHRQALDWSVTGRSIGVLNPNLSLPFTPNPTTLAVLPNSVSLLNGIWSGFLSVQGTGSNVFLNADNGNGNPGSSNPFDLIGAGSLSLSLPAQTFSTTPGVQPASISIPAAVSVDLSFSLASSNPSKIGVPSQVLIPAGSVSAGFNITNYNDSVLDGVQFVTVSASNYLFVAAQGTITNFSAPVALGLSLPNTISQQSLNTSGQGSLSTTVPVGSNFQAQLYSSDGTVLTLPPFVQIPAGQTNAAFTFVIPSPPEILGNRTATVTAFVGPAATASNAITILGNQSFNLNLVLPTSPFFEGAGAAGNATVGIPGILPTNLVITLTSSVPALVQISPSVIISTGQTSAPVPLTVLSNTAAGADLSVMITASAPGFTTTSGSVSIQDTHLDHFAFAGIPMAQQANQPFTISLTAENQSGDILRSYNGSVSLSPIGPSMGGILPAQTGNFTNGLWVGSVTVTTTGTNVIISAQDGTALGQSNPFNVTPVSTFTVNSTVSSMVYDPGTDRIYASIPSTASTESNTVLRLNPYTAEIENYIPVDTDPGLMTRSASNQYLFIAVQGGYSIERLNLASQTPDLEFPLTTNFPPMYAANMMSLPASPQTVAVSGISTYGPSEDFIFDGSVSRTDLTDLALAPGLDQGGILSSGLGYLQNGLVLAPTNQQPIGQFVVPGTLETRGVAPDPGSQRVFFLSQGGGQTVIYAYNAATFTLEGSQIIPGVAGTPQNLIRWGTNGLAFSTTASQIYLLTSPLLPPAASAQLVVSQWGPPVIGVGSNLSITITITNSGGASAADVVLYNPLPAGASFATVSSTQGMVQNNNGILTGLLGIIPPGGNATISLTLVVQTPGTLTNVVALATSTSDLNSALETSTWLTTVNPFTASDQITQLLISAGDLTFDSTDGYLYASVSGEQAPFGNSIVIIDPNTLRVIGCIPVGPNPGALALSPDGRYLYVYLNSSSSFELVDLQQRTVGFQDSIYGLALTEMFVLPGSSESLLFSQHNPNVSPSDAGAQIINGGVASALANLPGIAFIQPSLASNVFYDYDNGEPSSVSRIQINGTNTTSISAGGLTQDTEPEIRSGGDLLFFASGEVVDPESMVHVASFPGLPQPPYRGTPSIQICADVASARVYYLLSSGSTAMLMAYSLNTYQAVASINLSGISGTPEQLIRWGTNGLAFATTGGQLFSIQTSLIPTNQPADMFVTQTLPSSALLLSNFTISVTVSNRGPGVATGVTVRDILPQGMSFVSASLTQDSFSINSGALTASLGTLAQGATTQLSISLRPEAYGSSVNYVRVAANEGDPVMTNNSSFQSISVPIAQNVPMYTGDIVYDPIRGRLFATTQNDPVYSNSIVQINPSTGNVEQALSTTFTPAKIAISTDSQYLYVGTTQDGIVARINIQSWTNDLTFPLGNDPNNIAYVAGDFAPLPGQPHSVAVSLHAWYGSYNPKVEIFDDGVGRPNMLAEGGAGTYFIQASPDASTLYVVNGDGYQGYAVNPLTLSANPISAAGIGNAPTNIPGYSSDFRIEDNLLVTQNGQLFNLTSVAPVGNFPVTGLVAPDFEDGLVYFLVETGSVGTPAWTLMACATNSLTVRWQVTIPGATGAAYGLTRCGPNMWAFATAPSQNMNYFLIPIANRFFLVNTAAIPAAGDLILSVATNNALAGVSLTNTFTILNDGPFMATGVSFTNVLASGSTFQSATTSQGTITQTNGIVTVAVGAMTPGASVTITVRSTVSTPGLIALTASVSKNEPDLNPANNQISLTETIYPVPNVHVGNVSVYRQNGAAVTFNIQFDSAIPAPVRLYCSTTNGSALASRDYLAANSIVTIPAGALSTSFSVTIRDSGLAEPSLVFYLNLALSPSGPALATASCTLLNYDFYSFSVTNISLIAGINGATNATFFVKLSGTNFAAASVDYFTLDGSAFSGVDYLGKSGTLLFASGVTTVPVSLPVYPKLGPASPKSFYLLLANPQNGVVGVPQATASILYTNYPLTLGPSRVLTNGNFQLTAEGGALGENYVLLASTNLVDWTPIAGFVDSNSPVTIYDPNASQFSKRFYRLGPSKLAPAPKLGPGSAQSFGTTGFHGIIEGFSGMSYEIDASTNLVDWHPVRNFVTTNSVSAFWDPSATNYSIQFYRAVLK
jgi:uncharacterized repeat protein (TIGR01451 family)